MYVNAVETFHSDHCAYFIHSQTSRTTKGTYLTLTCQSIGDLQDLYAFFSTLGAFWPPANFDSTERDVAKCLAEIEMVLAADFLEKMPSGGLAGGGGGSTMSGLSGSGGASGFGGGNGSMMSGSVSSSGR